MTRAHRKRLLSELFIGLDSKCAPDQAFFLFDSLYEGKRDP